MKFLIVGDLHHPQELAKARQDQPRTEEPLLFPPSQGQYFWIKALRALGHQVDSFIRSAPALFNVSKLGAKTEIFTGRISLATAFNVLASYAPTLHPDYRVRNQRLLAKVAQYQPDALLLSGGNKVIFPQTLDRIKREHGCKIVYLSGVSPIVFSYKIERQAAPFYDLALVNDYYHGIQWLELGARQMEALPISACDPDFHHPYTLTAQEQAEYGCNVGFVGTLLPDKLYSTRVDALEAVRDCDLGIWSVHSIPPVLQQNYRGPALGEKMLRILCGSRIQVNPHGNFMRYGGNMRLFEASACGVFQIADDLPGVKRWFTPGETLEVYRSPQHLRELVSYYLAHEDERHQIAEHARQHVYAHHTYMHRMKAITEML